MPTDEQPSVLAIDDNPANLHLLAQILGGAGYDVRLALNGHAGLTAARRMPPDLVLLDIHMPDADGYDVCRRFKEDRALTAIPIIFISAADDTLDKVRAFAAGGVDYIVRPFQVEEVLARVHTQVSLYRSIRQIEELAAARERERLARELHDAVNQTLFSINLAAETALRQHAHAPGETADRLREIRALTQEAMVEMRVLMHELNPDMLTSGPLDDLLRAVIDTLMRSTAIPIVVDLDSPVRADPPVQIAFYRIAQEALTNIVRHAGAGNALVQLVDDEHMLRLCIRDDGRGFDPAQVTPGHYGLANIRARAAAIGAACRITSAVGRGTTIEIEWLKGDTHG